MESSYVLRPLVANILFWLWLLLALFTLWVTKTNRPARRVGAMLLLGTWLIATRPVAEGILWPLESRYTPPAVSSLRQQGVHQVVILGGGSFPLRGEMLSSAVGGSSLSRFMGGVELCARLGEGCRLIISGSAALRHAEWSDALTMQKLALVVSPGRQAVAEAQSRRTADHPRNIRPLVGSDPFVLVTSASHMPRAMRTFRNAGLDGIPYPTGFQVYGDYRWEDWLPNVDNLVTVQTAVKEYLGLVFYAVRGQ